MTSEVDDLSRGRPAVRRFNEQRLLETVCSEYHVSLLELVGLLDEGNSLEVDAPAVPK